MAVTNKTHDIDRVAVVQRQPKRVVRTEVEQEREHVSRSDGALERVVSKRPAALRPADILALQRIAGNRAVQRLLSNQPKALRSEPSASANFIQRQIEEEEPLQEKFETSPRTGNRTGLPENLKAGIESLAGISMDHVKVHYNSSRPAQLNALAYTQGSHIHVAPGQEQHLPHEAWHIVQQASGRVRPTMQLKDGVPVNDDEGLEREADVMGAKALTHAGSSPPTNLTQETDGSSGGNSAAAPVQRLIGFEVEYQVPTFGSDVEAVTLQGGAILPDAILKPFLFGGLAYGTKLGGSAEPGDNSFRLTTDHNEAVSREPIRAKLASMGKLQPADTVDRDASSNLEYVTSPVDELAKGSDKVLSDLIDLVSKHATSTFAIANAEKAGKIPAPAGAYGTGTPVDKFEAWLSAEDFNELKPTLESFGENILDSCYIQATIGVIPGAVGTLFEKAKDTEGVHVTGGQFSQIYTAVQTASQAAAAAVGKHKYIEDLQKANETQTTSAVSGMIRLLLMYLIGEALSQTSAFPGGTIKNAVPFLVKIDPSKIAGAGPLGMLFNQVPDDFVTALAEAISGQPEITVKYWTDLGYGARQRDVKDRVTAGSVVNLTKMFLQGKKPEATGAQTGSQLPKLDSMKEISDIFSQNEGQSGIPLEYRFVKARPTAAGLKSELLKIVKEAREVNLSRSSDKEREAIEKQVKE